MTLALNGAAGNEAVGRLRAATRSDHAATEAAVALLRAPVTAAAYRTFLRLTWGIMAPLEACLQCSPLASHRGLALAGRTPLLAADLEAVGDRAALLPLASTTPRAGTTARALGMLYVVEGSALGGAVLARLVTSHLPEAPTRYLRGYGDRTGASWRTVLGALGTHLTDHPHDEAAVIAGARETFHAVREWHLAHAWFTR